MFTRSSAVIIILALSVSGCAHRGQQVQPSFTERGQKFADAAKAYGRGDYTTWFRLHLGLAQKGDPVFVLAVPDVARTAAWWIEVMGFEPWMEPDGWRFVRRGACRIMLGECPDAIPPQDLGDHQYFAYVHVDDLDAYHAEIRDRGVDTIAGPADKPWGMREMAVRTPDGHRVMFGQELDG